FRCLLDHRVIAIDGHRLQSPQDLHGAVDVVHAPAPEPASVRLLFLADELEGSPYGWMVLVVSVSRKTSENAPCAVDRCRVKHRVMIGKGNVLAHHAVVVF